MNTGETQYVEQGSRGWRGTRERFPPACAAGLSCKGPTPVATLQLSTEVGGPWCMGQADLLADLNHVDGGDAGLVGSEVGVARGNCSDRGELLIAQEIGDLGQAPAEENDVGG